MTTVKQLLSDVNSLISPTARPPEVDRMVDAINAQLKKRKIKAKAELGGSFAKDTWLVGDHDVDIFVAFDMSYKDKPLSDILAPALAFLKPQRVHGSRDYFQLEDHLTFEIIPVLKFRKPTEAQNITDFSLHHVAWVNSRTKRLKTDIRLAKKFCKSQRVYGAESYIRGFSGHVVDLLVIKYGGFIPLLRAASKWKGQTVIDLPNNYKGKALMMMNKSKTTGPLVLVDPVQPERNAAASLTGQNYDRFIHAAKMFLAKPSDRFFSRQPVDFDALSKKGALIRVEATAHDGNDDVVGTKILKLFDHLHGALEDAGFSVDRSSWEWTASSPKQSSGKKQAMLWYLTQKTLPATRIVMGPPVAIVKHATAFKKKYRKVKIVKGRLVATVKNELRTPAAIIALTLKDPIVKEKAQRARLI